MLWEEVRQKAFLRPLHRLDQPCTGVILLAKTSKAASRITAVWKQGQVKKEYACVLCSASALQNLKRASCRHDENGWYQLQGNFNRSRKPGSVTVMPVMMDERKEHYDSMRLCTIQWKFLHSSEKRTNPLIIVKTFEGARHMVRALLANVGGAPIAGDVRYGAWHPLADRSVALHALRVTLPATLVLPLDRHEFVAPLPTNWDSWFGYNAIED